MCCEPIFASVSSSSSSSNTLIEGDIAETLLKKRQKLQTIAQTVQVQKMLDADQRDANWFSDVEFELKKTLNLTQGRLGRLRDIQQTYQDWLHVAFEESILEVAVNSSEESDDKNKSAQQELTKKRLEIEATLSDEYRKILEMSLKNIPFASIENPKVPLESMTSYLLVYVDGGEVQPLAPLGKLALKDDCTPCAKQDMTLKSLLAQMNADLVSLQKIQKAFEPVYATLGSAQFNVHHLSKEVRNGMPTLMNVQNHYLEEKNFDRSKFGDIKTKLLDNSKDKQKASAALATAESYGEKNDGETTVPLGEMLVRNYCLAQWSEHLLGGMSMVAETLEDQNSLCSAGAGGRFFKDSLHFTVLLLEDFLASD